MFYCVFLKNNYSHTSPVIPSDWEKECGSDTGGTTGDNTSNTRQTGLSPVLYLNLVVLTLVLVSYIILAVFVANTTWGKSELQQ